jgi:hypothetical protein
MTEVLGVPVPDARTSPNQLLALQYSYCMPGTFCSIRASPIQYARTTKEKEKESSPRKISPGSCLPRDHTYCKYLRVCKAGGAFEFQKGTWNTIPTESRPHSKSSSRATGLERNLARLPTRESEVTMARGGKNVATPDGNKNLNPNTGTHISFDVGMVVAASVLSENGIAQEDHVDSTVGESWVCPSSGKARPRRVASTRSCRTRNSLRRPCIQ